MVATKRVVQIEANAIIIVDAQGGLSGSPWHSAMPCQAPKFKLATLSFSFQVKLLSTEVIVTPILLLLQLRDVLPRMSARRVEDILATTATAPSFKSRLAFFDESNEM